MVGSGTVIFVSSIHSEETYTPDPAEALRRVGSPWNAARVLLNQP